MSRFWFSTSLAFLFLLCIKPGLAAGENRKAQGGVIDASAWDLDNIPFPLRGQWMFHWKRLYSPEEIRSEAFLQEKAGFIENPSGSWDTTNPEFSKRGYATYVLQIKGLKAAARELSISFSQFAGSHKTWLYLPARKEAFLLADVGAVSTEAATSIPGMKKVNTELPELDGSDVYLIMGVSTFSMDSGFSDSAFIASTRLVQLKDTRQVWQCWFVLGMFVLLIISNCSLYVLRPEDKPSLLIAAFSLVMGYRFCCTEALFARFFPEASWQLFYWTFYPNALAFHLGLAIYFQFFQLSFPGYFPRRAVQVGWLVTLTYATLMFLRDSSSMQMYFYSLLPMLALNAFMFLQLVRATWKRVRGAALAFLGIALFVGSMVNDVLTYVETIHTPYVGHYGMIAFIFCQSLVVGSNFAFAFRTADKLSKELQVEVERQTRDVKVILSHIHQGIFTVRAPGLLVGDDYSKFLEHILETRDIKDRQALDLIFSGSDLNAEQKSMIQSILEGSINETSLNFELNHDNLIREMHLKTPSGREKILLVDWQPVVNEKSDVVEKMLVTLRDVTELKAMEQQSRRQQRDIELITEIIEINPEKFDIFMKTGRNFIAENRRLIEAVATPDSETLKILFINMHTIKGAARTYRFKSMTGVVHDCEQGYAQVQKQETAWSQREALQQLKLVEEVFQEYDVINRQKLKRNENLDVVRIDLETVRENIKHLQEIEEFKLDERMTPFVDYVRKTFYHLYYMEVEKLFEDICKSLPTLAKDLKKPTPKVSFTSVPAGISNEGCEVLRNIFVHMLRNTMDHGIEDAETRLKKGKAPEGLITVDISMGTGDSLYLIYHDDGAGLQLQKIRELGARRGLIAENESDPQKVAELVFMAGFSTAKSVNDISGRGVGMSAIREYVQKMGGAVKLNLKPGSQEIKATEFAFEIRLPAELFTIFKEEKKVA